MNSVSDLFSFVLLLGLLTIIGVGPLVWLTAPNLPTKFAPALAPAAGLAVINLLAFPLVRYVAPAQAWAGPLAAGLAVLSLVLLALDWRRRPQRYAWVQDWHNHLPVIAFVLAGTLLVASPLLLLGIQYRIFRSNPSDALWYMSLAETLRVSTWSTVLGGMQIQDNQAGLATLANVSPTALLAARAVIHPLALNKMAALAWMAEIAHSPITHAYFLHHLLALASSVPAAFFVASRLTRSRGLRLLAAAAVGLGFWARLVLEMDAGYELSAIPMGLLFVAGWIELEREGPHAWSRHWVWAGVALAAIVAINFPLTVVLAAAFGVYYGVGLLQRRRLLPALLDCGAILLVCLVTLGVTGQLDFLFRSVVWVTLNVGSEAANPPVIVKLIETNGLAAVWGMPESILFANRSLAIRWPLREINESLALALTAGLIFAGYFSLRKPDSVAGRIILALLAGGLLAALESFWQGNLRTAGKAMTYVYPYLTLSVLLIPQSLGSTAPQRVQRAISLLVGVWLAYQGVLGPYITYAHSAVDALGLALNNSASSTLLKQGKNYNLSPIESYLDEHPPHLLLVTVPRDIGGKEIREQVWPFAFYAMFTFARFPHYFQSGFIIDNDPTTSNLWFGSLTQAPDYAVILKDVDYIGPEGLGIKVAETENLTLYRLNASDLSLYNQHEQAFHR